MPVRWTSLRMEGEVLQLLLSVLVGFDEKAIYIVASYEEHPLELTLPFIKALGPEPCLLLTSRRVTIRTTNKLVPVMPH